MIKIILFLIFLSFNGFGQIKRGGTNEGVQEDSTKKDGQTFALLVGISDYQNIRDLKYADRDAEVFYGYLNEVAKVPKQNIFLFTNQKATRKNISNAISQLDTLVKKGDKIVVFIASHGDIEAENRPDETALLLLYDAPNGNYLASQDGYIKLIDLKRAFDKFTAKDASVIFFADACRSGAFNLIESDTVKGGIKGKERFQNGIQQPWLNQIKYVSCQVNEYSLEGPEYSCGRGLFSLHSVDGLMGMADTEKDGNVTFAELQEYVNSLVRVQASPRIQHPQKVNGDDNTEISAVDSTAFANYQLKQIQFAKTHQGDCSPFFSGTNIKGDTILIADIDPQFREDYMSFYKNLKNKNLIYPAAENSKVRLQSFDKKLKNKALPMNTTQFLKIVVGNMKADFIEALQQGCMKIIKPLLIEIEQYNPPKYAVYDTAINT